MTNHSQRKNRKIAPSKKIPGKLTQKTGRNSEKTIDEQLKRHTHRLAVNKYSTDEGHSHIEVNQERARATNAGPLLVKVCPAHVYSLDEDGNIQSEFAACLECGTCRAVAPQGVLKWHYPRGGKGIEFRHG